MATPPYYGHETLYGPFWRGANDDTQTAESMRDILRSGELWGKPPRFAPDRPQVQCHHGPLPDGREGFELYSFAPPDQPWGYTPTWAARDDGTVWLDDGKAKMNIVVSRVRQEIAP